MSDIKKAIDLCLDGTLYEVFGHLLSEEQVRNCTLLVFDMEGLYTEVYLWVDEYWVEEIATPLSMKELLAIKFELVQIKGRIWNKESNNA